MLEGLHKDAEQRMKKSVESLNHELAKLRTGRAHPSILEGIMVPYYGQDTPLAQVASVTVEDARTLSVTPWEKNLVEAIDRAIRNSDLGLNPSAAGTIIRVPLPALTEETRKALAKQMRETVEGSRVAIRNIRRDTNNSVKALTKKKEITEDDQRRSEEKVQKLTDRFIAEVEKMADAKEADLMKI